jgi:hypothetical protein
MVSLSRTFYSLPLIFALTLDGRFVEINMNFNEALPAIIQIFDYDKPKPGVSITRRACTTAFTTRANSMLPCLPY